MNIEALKDAINSDLPKEVIKNKIIDILSRDESVIPTIMKILERERNQNNELISDMNLELSRAHIYIDMRPENKTEVKDSFNKNFVIDEIAKFYIKWKHRITHCFNRFN